MGGRGGAGDGKDDESDVGAGGADGGGGAGGDAEEANALLPHLPAEERLARLPPVPWPIVNDGLRDYFAAQLPATVGTRPLSRQDLAFCRDIIYARLCPREDVRASRGSGAGIGTVSLMDHFWRWFARLCASLQRLQALWCRRRPAAARFRLAPVCRRATAGCAPGTFSSLRASEARGVVVDRSRTRRGVAPADARCWHWPHRTLLDPSRPGRVRDLPRPGRRHEVPHAAGARACVQQVRAGNQMCQRKRLPMPVWPVSKVLVQELHGEIKLKQWVECSVQELHE